MTVCAFCNYVGEPKDHDAHGCIFDGCASTDRHSHGGFYGGYTNPADPTGPPIAFTTEPSPGVRDYNGRLLESRMTAHEWMLDIVKAAEEEAW